MGGNEHEVVTGLLRGMIAAESSDLHLVAGYPPTYRVHGRLSAVGSERLTDATIRAMVAGALPEPHRTRVTEQRSTDCSLAIDCDGRACRFRANVFYARHQMGACFRYIPDQIPTFEWMGFPAELAERIVAVQNGLVIVTGVTGSGKTTTLAAMINMINERDGRRVITVEDPVEYVYDQGSSSIVTQREVGVDVDSFYDGLVSGLRQDPDVILVGEIRDRETARMALSAAETGHLVFTTLHTQDAKGVVTRLVDLFPRDTQDDIRSQLSLSLRYVVCQHLLPATDASHKRVLAVEVVKASHAVRAAIRFGKVESIESLIQTGRKDGMIAFDVELARLAGAGRITWETAKQYAKDPDTVTDYGIQTRGM